MKHLAFFVIIFFIIALIIKYKRFPSHQIKDFPVYSCQPLSHPEMILYFRLCKCLPNFIILSQVSLSRFIKVKPNNNFGHWFNQYNRMTVDFVVCNKNFNILSIIELDDNTHNKPKRQNADSKKNKILHDANIPLIRWQSIPNESTIKEQFKTFS